MDVCTTRRCRVFDRPLQELNVFTVVLMQIYTVEISCKKGNSPHYEPHDWLTKTMITTTVLNTSMWIDEECYFSQKETYVSYNYVQALNCISRLIKEVPVNDFSFGLLQLSLVLFPIQWWPGGGGGGSLGYFGGRIRSLSKLKNTPTALISGQKSTLILIKRWFFPLNKHPFFYQNTDIGWTGTRILS